MMKSIRPDDPFYAHVDAHCVIGRDGNGIETPYVSFVALREYWDAETIEFYVQAANRHYLDTKPIGRSYLKVLSTLVMINSVEYIEHFIHHDLNDTKLPLLDNAQAQRISSIPSQWWDSFYNTQWRFCPVEFSSQKGLSRRKLDSREIWPAMNQEPMTVGQGELARTFKMTVDPNCIELPGLKNICVFKEYTTSGYSSFQNEINAYTSLRKLSYEASTSSIIDCYDWFQQGDKHTIILEYAEFGSLIDYWKGVHEPAQPEDIDTLWTNVFELFQGLAVIHGNWPRTQEYNHAKMFGMHRDIKPGNILVFAKPSPSNDYDVQFKIADFGLSLTRPILAGQPSPIDRDPGGSRMYNPPETTRLLDWTDTFPIEAGQHVDIWGMGCVLSEMASWVVGGDPERERYRQLREAAIPVDLKQAGYSACFHNGAAPLPMIKEYHYQSLRNMYRIGDTKSPRVGQMVVKGMLRKHPADRLTAQQLHTRAIQLEDEYDLLVPQPSSLTYPAPRISATHSRRSSGDTDEPHGPGSHRNSSVLEGGSSIPASTPSSPSIPESTSKSNQLRSHPQQRLPYRIITQPQPLRFPNKTTPVQQPPMTPRASTMPSRPISNQYPHDLPSEKPIEDSYARSSPTNPYKSEHPAERHKYEQAEASNQPETEPHNTVDYLTILNWKADKKKALYKLFNSSKANSLEQPWLRRLESARSQLEKREMIFIIDDSSAMERYWTDVVNLFKALYLLVKDKDPNGIDVYFTSDPAKLYRKSMVESLDSYIDKIRKRTFDLAPCPMEKCLSQIFRGIYKDMAQKGASTPQTSLFILSNGDWAPNGDDISCGVATPIKEMAQKLASLEMDRFQLSLQFVRFNTDDVGTGRLKYLDDDIKKEFGLKFDIVDQKHFTADICSILRGSLDREADGRKG